MKPLKWVLAGLGMVVLLLAGLCLFFINSASWQKSILTGILQDHAERVEVDYFKAGFSSLTIRGLLVEQEGTLVQLPEAQADYSLWGALFSRELRLTRLLVKDLNVTLPDARERPPAKEVRKPDGYTPPSRPTVAAEPYPKPEAVPAAKEPMAPFQGVLSQASLPMALYIDGVDVALLVNMTQQSQLSAKLSGGGIAPGASGILKLNGQLLDRSPEAAAGQVSLEGSLTLAQTKDKGVNQVAVTARLEASGGSLPEPAILNMNMGLTMDDSQNENYTLALEDGKGVSLLSVAIDYQAVEKLLKGEARYGLSRAEVAPFLGSIDTPMFRFEGKADFSVHAETYASKAQVDMSGRLAQWQRLSPTLADFPGIDFEVHFDGGSDQGKHALHAASFVLKQAGNGNTILSAQLKTPLDLTGDTDWTSLQGRLAELAIEQVRLNWFNAMIPAIDLASGRLNGTLALEADQGVLRLVSETPLTLQMLNVSKDGQALVRGLKGQIPLSAEFGHESFNLNLRNVRLQDEANRDLLVVSSVLEGKLENGQPGDMQFRLNSNVFLQELLDQPFTNEKLPEALSFRSSLVGSGNPSGKVSLERLSLSLRGPDDASLMGLNLLQPLEIDTNQPGAPSWPQGDLLRLAINTLPRPVINAFLPGMQLTDGDVNARFLVNVEGDAVRVNAERPLRVTSLSVSRDGQPMLDRIDLQVSPTLLYQGDAVTLNLPDLDLKGAGQALATGQLNAAIKLGADSPLQVLGLHLDADLAALLSQPVARPWNNLSAGRLQIKGEVKSPDNGSYNFTMDGRNWRLREPVQSISRISATASGDLKLPGSVTLEAPLSVVGPQGRSEAKLSGKVNLAVTPAKFQCDITGNTLYSDDLLLLAAAFRAPVPETAQPVAVAASSPGAPAATPARTAEPVATAKPGAADTGTPPPWAAYTGKATLAVTKLIHGQYEVDAIKGVLTVDPEKVVLKPAGASFLGAPLQVEATVDHQPVRRPQTPYGLDAKLDLKQFDVGRFLTLGKPATTPPLSGLFAVRGGIQSTAPAMDAFADRATGTFQVDGGPGKLRALAAAGDKADTAATAASVAVGVAGALLGNRVRELPALNQLISLLREIDYDTMQIKAVRGLDMNVLIDPFLVQGPQVRLVGKGKVTHEEGVPIPSQPLEVGVTLDAKGQTANLLSELRLVTGKADAHGYFPGPRFTITGTASQPDFAELNRILTQTAMGIATGGFGGQVQPEQPRESERKPEPQDAVRGLLRGLMDR